MTNYKPARSAAALAALFVPLFFAPFFALLPTAPAHAALFGDDEARAGVQKLQAQQAADEQRISALEANLDNQTRLQAEMSAQMEQLRNEVAKLRGQIEVLTNDLENAQKRQKDFYTDLDARLRKLEPPPAPAAGAPSAPPTADEQRAYEAGLNLVKTSNYKSAVEAFTQFLRTYPNSQLAPSAQYWVGNSYFALRDYKAAIAAQGRVLEFWPQDVKAPDALLNVASAQLEMKDPKAARATLEDLVKRYPGSDAAKTAQERIRRLR